MEFIGYLNIKGNGEKGRKGDGWGFEMEIAGPFVGVRVKWKV